MPELVLPLESILAVLGFATLEDQRNAVVWRYLTFEKFRSLLESQAVWFSRLGALQDEFEGILPEKIYQWAKERERLYAEPLASNPEMQTRNRNFTEKTVDSGRLLFAVNCWSLGAQESQQMWNEYVEQGTGVAIRSTVERLSLSFPKLGGLNQVSVIDRIHYVDFKTFESDVTKADNIDWVAFLKIKEKSHEEEVRILTPNICFSSDGSSIKPDQFKQSGLLVSCQLQKLIQAIVVGPQTGQNFFTRIEKLVARHGLGISVERSTLPKLPSPSQ